MKEFLGKTKNGFKVCVDIEASHAVTHLNHTPQLLDLLKEIIPTLELEADKERLEKDMGRIVGEMDLVETSEEDEILYARRQNRREYTRFVKNKETVPTNFVTLVLEKSGENTYDLFTAYIGPLTSSFPGGTFLADQSKEFWSKHALIWGNQEIIPGTETTECPW